MPPVSIYDTLTPDQIARIRMRYEAGVMTVSDIARAEGLQVHQIKTLRERFGWPTRLSRAKRAVARVVEQEQAIAAALEKQRADDAKAAKQRRPRDANGRFLKGGQETSATAGAFDAGALVRRTTELLERELAAARARKPGETNAGELASLVRSLAILRDMDGGRKDKTERTEHSDDGPLDLAELRRELSRRIHELREGRAAAETPGDDERAPDRGDA